MVTVNWFTELKILRLNSAKHEPTTWVYGARAILVYRNDKKIKVLPNTIRKIEVIVIPAISSCERHSAVHYCKIT
jgi:hypothetical protein